MNSFVRVLNSNVYVMCFSLRMCVRSIYYIIALYDTIIRSQLYRATAQAAEPLNVENRCFYTTPKTMFIT